MQLIDKSVLSGPGKLADCLAYCDRPALLHSIDLTVFTLVYPTNLYAHSQHF